VVRAQEGTAAAVWASGAKAESRLTSGSLVAAVASGQAGLLLGLDKTKLDATTGTNSGDNAVNSTYSSLVSNANHTGDVTGSTSLTIANKVTMTATLPVSVSGSPTVIASAPVVITIAAATTLADGAMSLGDKTKLDAVTGSNTGDNAVNTTYASDYRLANFVAGTDYLAPTGNASGLTNFPTLNQNTTGTAANVTGTVAVTSGGTGLTTTPANGALDIGNGSGFSRATLTAGTGITVTNASGAITIASSVIPTYYPDQASFPSAAANHGSLAHSHADGSMYFAHNAVWNRLLDANTTVTVLQGGTGATTTGQALTNLGAYAAANPNGYTTNTGTVTSVGGTGTVSGLSLTGSVSTTGNLTLGGTLAVANASTTATDLNTASTIVARDGSGNFFAGTITAALTGNATTATSATSATTAGTITSQANSATITAATTSTASTIVLRDASGDFAAGTITAALTGNASTATSAATAGTITSQANSATIAAASANTASTIVLRDASGDFAAGTITASLTGNASTATSATTAGSITSQANSATITAATANTASTVVLRDASGNFSAGTITAALTGNASTATAAGSITSQANSATIAAATSSTASTIVLRDASGDFAANTIGAVNVNISGTITPQLTKSKVYQDFVSSTTANSATTNIDLSLGNTFVVTISANTTLAFLNPPSGTDVTSFTIITLNDGTGGYAVSFPASATWAGGQLPTRTTAANKQDLWTFFTRNAGTQYVGTLSIANF
jgi:hypothetical protein